MESLISDWLVFLRDCETLVAIPLILCGLVLMMGGWRFRKPWSVVTSGLVGAVLGFALASSQSQRPFYALIGAVITAAASWPSPRYSVSVFGGLLGIGLVYALFGQSIFDKRLFWLVMGIGFFSFAGLAFINLRVTTVILTALQGAALVLSGLVILLTEAPGLFKVFANLSKQYVFFMPFLVLVPTMVGCFLQMGDARQKDSGYAAGD